MFGFVGDGDFCEVREGRKGGFFALIQEIGGEGSIVVFRGGENYGVVGLIGLEEDFGGIEVATTDAADDLGEEMEGALFRGEIGEREGGIGLNDADGGEAREIEAFGDGLGADDNVDCAGFQIVVEGIKGGFFVVVSVETGDFCVLEEFI